MAQQQLDLRAMQGVRNRVIVKEPVGGGAFAVKEYDFDDIKNMPIEQYYSVKNHIVNARKETYYDTFIFDPATTIAANLEDLLFTRGRNQEGAISNTGVEIAKKTLWHTNLNRNGEFDNDATVLIHSMEVAIFMPTILPVAGNYAQGILSNPIPSAEGAQAWSASLTYHMLKDSLHFVFVRSEQDQERGFLEEWTTRVGPTAVLGGDVNEGFVQNASFRENLKFDRVKVFEGGDSTFQVKMSNIAGAALTLQTFIVGRVKLRTRRIGVLWP
jgi:hypothetical protein